LPVNAVGLRQVIYKPAAPAGKARAFRQHDHSHNLPWTRDKHLGCIRRIGRAPYKQVTGYHRRSLAETAMFRVKTLFGNQARSRGSAGHAAELLIRCNALNRIAHLGLPDSYAV
jgi:transposase